MSRYELESRCRDLGYEPEEDDTDLDLLAVIDIRERF